jgi:hypothetical protein
MLDAEEGKQGTLSRFRELLGRSRTMTGAEDLVARTGRSVELQLLRDSRGKEALALAAEMLGTPAPDGCALAVIADHRRVGFVSVDRGGAVSPKVQPRPPAGASGSPPLLDPGLPGDQRACPQWLPRSAALAPRGPGLEPPGGPGASGRGVRVSSSGSWSAARSRPPI